MATKKCGKCETNKDITNFRPIFDKRDGNTYTCSWCKECEKERALQRYHKNREACIAKNKQYKQDHADELAAKRKEYLERTKDHVKARYRKYCETNKDKINEIALNYRNNNPHVKIKAAISARLREMIVKSDRTATYLGASMDLVMDWLEFNFTSGISWETHGSYWHIDHVLPVKCFDLENKDEMATCFSWMNLMPLEKYFNIKKSNKIWYPRIWYQEIQLRKFATQKNIDVKPFIKQCIKKLLTIDMRHIQIVREVP